MAIEQNHWIIQTKLFPPTQSINRIERQNLDENIATFSKFQLCIVHAFAGYGKTTFLKDWFEINRDQSTTSVWISLDEEDKNIGSFFTYLVEGLKKADISCESLQQLTEQGYQELPVRLLASALINVFCQITNELVIFLDDFHRADSEDTNELLETLVAYAPGNIKFVLASRVYPTFNVESFRANGKLIDVHATALRFQVEELIQLFENQLSLPDVNLLWERTEGWPIACQMAFYLLKQNKLSKNDILDFAGTNRDLSNYITEQVFHSLSETEQTFLITTSVVERFTAGMADCLSETFDAWTVIEQLERKKLFLIPLKGKDGWYRYHQLFRQYLTNKLASKLKTEASEIHCKASIWLFENNYVPEAIAQALQAKNFELAAQNLDRAGGWRLTFKGRLDFMQRTLKQLPEEIINSSPRLYLNKILLLIRGGKIAAARDVAQKFKQQSQQFSTWNEQPMPDLIKMEWIVVTDLLMGSYADVPATENRLSTLFELSNKIRSDDSILRGIIEGCMFHQYWERGDINSAFKIQNSRATTMAKEKPVSIYWSVYNFINISILEVEQCHLTRASDALASGLDLVERYPELDFNLHSAISVFLAELAYLQNNIEDAVRLMKPALMHLEQYDASFKHYAPAFVTMIALQRLTSDKKGVMELIARGYHVAATRQLPRLKTLCDIQLVKYLLLVGEASEARQKFNELALSVIACDLPNHQDLSVYLPELAKLTLARLHLSEGSHNDALALLDEMQALMISQKRFRILVELYLLKAKIFFDKNEHDNAVALVNKAVDISLHEDYKRAFIDEGSALLEIIKLALNTHMKGTVNQYYTKFLEEISKAISLESRTLSSRSGGIGLTDLEYKVVLEVSRGLSNKHIARLIDSNEDFVKYQLRKVFKKWGISSRDEAAKIMAKNNSTH